MNTWNSNHKLNQNDKLTILLGKESKKKKYYFSILNGDGEEVGRLVREIKPETKFINEIKGYLTEKKFSGSIEEAINGERYSCGDNIPTRAEKIDEESFYQIMIIVKEMVGSEEVMTS